MTIQKTAFEVQSALRTAHGIDVKRSHVHEVLAALLGHASYAAMSTQCVIAQFLGQASLRPLDIVGAAQRAQALGYAPPGPPVIATVGAEALNTHRLCAMKLDGVLSALGLADSTADSPDLSGDADFEDGGLGSADSWLELDLEADGLRDELVRLATGGSASAHLALTRLIDEQLDEDDPIEGLDGRYWSDRLEAGQALSGVELEWAETYQRHRELRSQRKKHLASAATLGSAEAAIQLAEDDFSSEAFDAATLLAGNQQARRLGELAWEHGHEEAARTWLRVAAAQGDVWAMKVLASELEEDLIDAWAWVHLANLLGTDVMAYHAVGEDGLPADADEAGPIYADGGFELDRLSEQADEDSRARAKMMLERIRRRV
jgi:hypothetical protein